MRGELVDGGRLDARTQEFRRQLLLVAGFSSEEIDEMEIAGLGDEEFQEIVRKKLLGNSGDCGTQKVISLDEVEEYLANGWEYVATLPNGRVIVKI